jgi:hypothetical protein
MFNLILVIILLTPVFNTFSLAAEIEPPQPKNYYSENKVYRFESIPNTKSKEIQKLFKCYFKTQNKKRPSAHGPIALSDTSAGVLYKTTDTLNRYIWGNYLSNLVFPESSMVSNHGYVITLGEWRKNKSEYNRISFYDTTGNIIKTYLLTDIIDSKTIKKTSFHKVWYDKCSFNRDNTFFILEAPTKRLYFDIKTGAIIDTIK